MQAGKSLVRLLLNFMCFSRSSISQHLFYVACDSTRSISDLFGQVQEKLDEWQATYGSDEIAFERCEREVMKSKAACRHDSM